MATNPETTVEQQLRLAIFRGALEEIAEEMDLVFERTAFSPVISDGWDRADGIYDGLSGEVIAQGARGLPIFVGVMQFTVQEVITRCPDMRDGDIYVVNDPYAGGTHLMDVKMVKPVFVDGRRVCFVANTGHWPDIGGRVPGGFTSEATEMYQEGLRLPPVRLVKEGKLDGDIQNIILANIRVPEDLTGDIQAQIAALEYGERRMRAMLRQMGTEEFYARSRDLREYSLASMKACLKGIPDGVYSAVEEMDNDGVTPTRLRIAVDVTIQGDKATLNFSASSPPSDGPMNSVLATTQSSCYVAFKHLFPDVPLNGGCFEPIEVVAPRSTFLNASIPRPVSGCAAETSQRIITAIHKALLHAIPDKVPASSFATVSNFSLGGVGADGNPYVMYMFLGGGYGAYHDQDGLSNGCSLISLARTQSLETMEQRYPVSFDAYALAENSGGRGMYRGGLGVTLRLSVEQNCRVSVLGDRAFTPAEGWNGGEPGAPLSVKLYSSDGQTKWAPPLGSKAENIPIECGDVLEIQTPGGGGYGDPRQRDAERVQADEENGYVYD